MDCIIPVIIGIGKCFSSPLRRHINYVIDYKDNIENLEDTVENLRAKREDAVRLAKESHHSSRVRSSTLEDWIRRFDELDRKMQELDDEAKKNNGCFKKLGINCYFRYRLGKEAARKIIIAKELKDDGNFSIISHSPPPPCKELMPSRGYVDFASTKTARLQIIETLKDNKVSIIGVHGMGGVGKTTLIKEVEKQMKTEEVFDVVIRVTVSQNQDVKRIQREIADHLGMRLNEESSSARASRLSQRLREAKKRLIILDDLWGRLELHDVGIPLGDDQDGHKIVLTTRKKPVCYSMECQQIIELGVLSEQESWELFKEKAGDVIQSPTLRDIAEKVCQECGRLPLAIVTAGRALKDKKRQRWEDALDELKKSEPITIEDMDAKVFASLALSYNNLEIEEMKLSFLFCCLFPEDSIIDSDTLMMYGIGERFIKDADSLKEARRRVRAFFDKLTDYCLLLDGNEEEDKSICPVAKAKMHDVVRDVAISIASKGEHEMLVKAGKQIEKLKMEILSKHKRISLMNCGISSLDDDCPENLNLLTLLLQENEDLQRIPDGFFRGMKNLVVLDLSGTSISSLPPSLPCLLNLRTLCLNRCYGLEDISLVGELKRLEILTLREARRISELTKGIGQLNNLMHLDLSFTSLKRVTPGVISMFRHVEELYMDGNLAEWEVEEWSSRDISRWTYLKRFRFQICGDDSERWDTLIADTMRADNIRKIPPFHRPSEWYERCLTLASVRKPVALWVQVLLGKTESLMLYRCITDGVECVWKLISGPLPSTILGKLKTLHLHHSIKSITIFPSNVLEMLSNVETIHVQWGQGVQVIFHFEEMAYERPLLCNLRRLKLIGLECLSSIWKGPVPDGSLHGLQKLKLFGCRSLKTLFSPEMAKSLLKLEKVTLRRCENIEKLISDEEEEREDKVADEAAELPEELGLPVDRKSSKCHISTAAIFRNLRILKIVSNKKLTSLLPLHLARGLVSLEHLMVCHCMKMEEIISTEYRDGDWMEEDNGVLFTCLQTLNLTFLPNLKRFCGENVRFEWASLERLCVCDCPSLTRLPIGNHSARKLEKFEAEWEWLHQLECEDNAVKDRLECIRTEPRRMGAWQWSMERHKMEAK